MSHELRRLILCTACVSGAVLSAGCGAELAVWSAQYYSSPVQPMHDGRPVTVTTIPPGQRVTCDGYSVLPPTGTRWVLVGGAGAPQAAGALFFVRDPMIRRAFEPIDVATHNIVAMSEIVDAPGSSSIEEASKMLEGWAVEGIRYVRRLAEDQPGTGCARYHVSYILRSGTRYPGHLALTTHAGRFCAVPGASDRFVHLWYREDQEPKIAVRYLAEVTPFFDSVRFQ